MSPILENGLQKMSSKSLLLICCWRRSMYFRRCRLRVLLLISCWRVKFQLLHMSSPVNKDQNSVHFHRF